MKFILIILSLLSLSLAVKDCLNAPIGYYCREDGGYTLCVNDYGFQFQCSQGTACQCGDEVYCDTPCTMVCEGVNEPTEAQNFCQERMDQFDVAGYFCNPEGSGFYHCVRDAYCPEKASPRSAFMECPAGTMCACGDTRKECSRARNASPCSWPSDYMVLESQECVGKRWDCIYFTNGDIHSCAEGQGCGEGMGSYCFWDQKTNDGTCTENFWCMEAANCETDSSCQPDEACIINSCCGTGGKCAKKCSL